MKKLFNNYEKTMRKLCNNYKKTATQYFIFGIQTRTLCPDQDTNPVGGYVPQCIRVHHLKRYRLTSQGPLPPPRLGKHHSVSPTTSLREAVRDESTAVTARELLASELFVGKRDDAPVCDVSASAGTLLAT